VSVTVSAGIAQAHAEGDSVDALVRRADQALYAAKAGGRDRCVLFSPPAQATR
jgi:PleD family two-component response regulator